jgi:NDP-sugar pyrophosphorylase family protein
MKAVILAGGLGHRLKPFTEIIPKPLLPLGDQSILEIQIGALRRCGAEEVVVATNYKSDLVRAYLGDGSQFGIKVSVSREDKPLGTAGPLSLLRNTLNEPFLMMNGDILTKLDFRAFYEFGLAQQSDLTVATKVITTPFRFGNVHVNDAGQIIDVDEKPEFRLEIVAGIYFVKPGLLRHVPDGQYYGMDMLIKAMIAAEEPVSRYLIREYWLDIGQVDDYSQARTEYEQHFAADADEGA